MDEVLRQDATRQAELIREGKINTDELLEASIQRLEELNPDLNAVVTTMFDEAKSQLEDLGDGPFTGVPFLLKDLLAFYEGVPMTSGSAFMEGFVPDHDSELVRRFKDAGLVILGKTNTPEFGIQPTTEPDFLGAAHNPWDLDRTTGGSSGGSAAAVAAGIVPMAHANDGGGSIRIPASCCGLFGMKPTRARTSLAPEFGDLMSGLVIEHAVTRSVRDSARLLDYVDGSVTGDPYRAPEKRRPYVDEVNREVETLRIGVTDDTPIDASVHDDCREAISSATELCEDLGHNVEELQIEIESDLMMDAFMTVWSAGAAAAIDGLAMEVGKEPEPEYFEPLTWALYEMAQDFSSSDYLLATTVLQRLSREFQQQYSDYDVIVTPTLAEPPIELGELDSTPENPLEGFTRAAEFAPFTALYNVTGQPAMSIPLYWNDENLPIGVQFAGRFGEEGLLFRLASQLEDARPWHDRTPDLI